MKNLRKPAYREGPAPDSAVMPGQCAIAHQDRAIQYSEAVVIESMGRGVLDAPPAAYAEASAGPDLSLGEALA